MEVDVSTNSSLPRKIEVDVTTNSSPPRKMEVDVSTNSSLPRRIEENVATNSSQPNKIEIDVSINSSNASYLGRIKVDVSTSHDVMTMTLPNPNEILVDAQSDTTGQRLPSEIRQQFSKIILHTRSDKSSPQFAILLASYTRPEGPALTMAASSNSDIFVGFSKSQIIKWHMGEPVQIFQSSSSSTDVCAVVVRDQLHIPTLIISGHNDGLVRVRNSNGTRRHVFHNATLSQRLKKFVLPRRDKSLCVTSLCISDDHKFVYIGSQDGTLNTWLIQSKKLVDSIQQHDGCINALAVGLNVVFSGSTYGTVKKWRRDLLGNRHDNVQHNLVASYLCHPNVKVNCILFSPSLVVSDDDNSNNMLYAGLADGRINCWRELQPNQPENLMRFHRDAVNALALSSFSFLYSGSADNTICIWLKWIDGMNVSHSLLHVLKEHVAPVTCLVVSQSWDEVYESDGRKLECPTCHLYSGATDGTIKIWSVVRPPSYQQRTKF